jgi:serine/threonine-protein kinase
MTLLAGKYELVRPLGVGGMAEVWEAVLHGDAGFRRRVAVKRLIAPQQGDERLQRLFVDEARLASRLHHANLVAVIDFGVEDGVAFQVLELVDGFDVARLANWGASKGSPMPIDVAVGITAAVAHALHSAHTAVGDDGAALNVVHRDVSPHNILVSRSGDVKLADFGVARWAQRTEKTLGPTSVGKPTYMAPEQATRGSLDGRADVFSLACTLHALLTQESPLRNENAMVDLLAGIELEPSVELPGPVREVLVKALRRDRQARQPSAEAFAVDCERALRAIAPADFELRRALRAWMTPLLPAEVAIAGTPSPGRSVAKPGRFRWWPAVGGAVVLTLLIGVSATRWSEEVTSPSAPSLTPVAASPPPVDLPPPPSPVPTPSEAPEAPPPKPAFTTAKPKPPVTARGVVAIGGERFLKAEILADGNSVGLAPRQLELTVGTHRLELVLPSGERVGPRSVTVAPQHTELSPLRWIE